MTSNPRTYSDSCLIYLDPPNSGHAHAEIKTVLRNKIMIYANAPHGYYIGRDPQGNQYLFSFVNGEDAMEAFHDALMRAAKTHETNTSSTSSFRPIPMKTGQHPHSTTGNPPIFNTQPRGQPSRMAGQEKKTHSHYIRQSDINSLLPLQEINIGSNVSSAGRKYFYYLRANVDDTTPGPRGLEFELPIDTGSQSSWLFVNDFNWINGSHMNYTIEKWPTAWKQNTDTIKWPFTVQGPNNLKEMPRKISAYGSDGYVGKSIYAIKLLEKSKLSTEVCDGPLKSNVVVTLHGWDWAKKDHSTKGFKIHDGFDFVTAANEQIIWEGYDGNIGLGPRQGDLQTGTSRNFLASLTTTRQIIDSSIFIIRLVHPDDLDNAPLDCNLFNIISFGPGFPFQAPVSPDAYFSSPIPTISKDIAGAARPEKWRVKLLRIGICSVDRNDYSWIDMDNTETKSSIIQGIDILMDTGTPMTVLPDYVVAKIQSDEKWLGSSRQTQLDLLMNDKTYTRLAHKKIRFEFKGEGRHPVGVTVSAKSFMAWYSKVEAGDNPKLHLCSIKGSHNQDEFALGQNWYWAAIVKHVSPREKRKFPFVQVMSNGYFFDYDTNKTVRPTDMILKPLPPRLGPTD
ncbi:hypothetical protein F5879DRAFT_1039373 [Lentinula edodes]|nr:uncharacterized protein C8R40DRAFT_1171661 [Lentinula edodes]KAH7874169.1 hypothetical protein C8R40DRAFT_1171661 [Lentinula edodes]KAJ3903094.1 hypothetical protein F5879DRAFT_1039373 [Lentinula edodes]